MIDFNFDLATFRVKEVVPLTEETFILRTDRNHIDFKPGQWVSINLRDDKIKRKYSIYSGTNEPFLEFLIREVTDGYLTPKLKPFKKGDELEIYNPKGNFTLDGVNVESDKLLFVATGTGIAPFHSMIKTHPDLDYRLVHGVGFFHEAYHLVEYERHRSIVCTSREKRGDHFGRVTSYLSNFDFTQFDHIFLCGNHQMTDEVTKLVLSRGIPPGRVHAERYF